MFQDCPQTSTDESGCLQQILFGAPQPFRKHGALRPMPCPDFLVHVLWFEGLSHSGRRLCRVRDQGDAGGHAVGSGQSLAGRWRPAGGAAGVHLVIRSETLHYMYLWTSNQTPHYMYLLVVGSETLHYMYLWSSDQRHYTTCICGRQIRDTTLHVSLVVRSETLHCMYLRSDGGRQAWLSIWSMSMYLWWSDQRH